MQSPWQLGWEAIGAISGFISLVVVVAIEWDRISGIYNRVFNSDDSAAAQEAEIDEGSDDYYFTNLEVAKQVFIMLIVHLLIVITCSGGISGFVLWRNLEMPFLTVIGLGFIIPGLLILAGILEDPYAPENRITSLNNLIEIAVIGTAAVYGILIGLLILLFAYL